MSVKKITSITMAILVSQLMGCAAASQSEMLQKINNGDQIQIEIDTPSNQEQGAEQSLDWLPLDQLNTNPELRKAIDELFKIVQESDSKNGVFYVDLEGNQNGNNTLYNTFVNSKFRGYWNDSSVMKQLAEIAFTTYTDVETEGNKYTTATLAALNGYFNLLADAAPSYANMNSTLTRLEAMAALYKAENPVTDSLAWDKAFTQAVDAGNKNPNTIYAANLKEYSYLNIETSSLDNMTANGTITRGEFVYMLVQKYFKADYDKANPKAVSYADVINGGYIASEQKFIEAGEAKKYWQTYELTYALQNPDQGVPERLYKALVVAHEKGIITDTDSRWDEGLTKADFFELLINTYLAIPAVTNSERGLTEDQEVAANGKETNLSENRNTGSGSTNTTGRSTSQSSNGANTTSGSTSASTNTDSRSTSQSTNTNSSNTSGNSNSANTAGTTDNHSANTAPDIDYTKLVEGIKVTDSKGIEKKYFEKTDDIILRIQVNNPDAGLKKITVNNKEFALEKTGTAYTANLGKLSDYGVHKLSATKIHTNDKSITINSIDNTIEILKDKPYVKSLESTIDKSNNTVAIDFNIVDSDSALVVKDSTIRLLNKGAVLETKQIKVGENSITFSLPKGNLADQDFSYEVNVGYDLDTNALDSSSNSVAGEVLTDGRIILDPGKLEVKDITSKTLYYKGKEVSELDITNSVPTDLGNYYLKIESSSVPTLYANIKRFNYLEDEAKLTAVADLDNFIHYKEANGKLVEYSDMIVDLPFIKGNTTTRLKSAASFIEEINKDLTGNYKLTSDLDASGLNGSSYLIPGNFTGTIDGNGFTIYNLEKPLVQNLKGGTIKNLTLDSAKITGANGILALEIMNGGTVENVSIKNSSLSFANNDMLGSICKVLTNGTITGCDIINTTISGRFTIGGIAGQINENGTVRDCLVDATLISSSNHGSLGPRVGGVSGWHNGLIEKTYVDVVIQAPAKNGNGGFIGGPNNANTVRIKDSFAATSGNCNTIAGFTAALSNTNNITNLYEFAEAGVSSHGLSYITSVNSKADKGIQDNLNLSDRIWNYVQKKNANLSGGIEKVENYNENAQTAYYNISKLAPYLNSYDIVDAGNRLVDSALKTKRISFIVPFDASNNMIIGLTADTVDSIQKIKVVFEDNSYRDFTVTYTELFDKIIAAYKIDGLNLDYHFNKYVCDIDTALKGDMVNLVNSYDYSADLDPITSSADKRQYRDFYQDYLKADLDSFIHNILISQEDYASCLDNAYFKANVKNELTNNLKEITYGYNYYSKWYDLNFGSINLRDLLFFNGESIDEGLSMEYLTETVCSGSKIHTRETYDFFENNLKNKLGGRDLYETLEMFIDLTGSSDYNKWFDDNFDGILKEQNVIGFTPQNELKYRIWDNMKKLTGIDSHLLLVLNIPKEFQQDIIVISAPSQLVFSSVNIYYAEANEVTRKQTKTAVNNFAALLGKYYGTSLAFVENGESNLNRDIFVNYDTILHFRSTKYPGNQSKNSEEPLVKWVFDAQERLYSGSAGAIANGKYTCYGYNTALNQQGFGLFSHENAHNQDSKYFYDNAGRRRYSGGEHHCEGVLTLPEYYDGHLAFNLTREYNFTDYVVTNLSPGRIASKESIKDFYKDIFDSWYALNAIYGEAFIGSPSGVKENVSKKVREYRLTDGDPNATSSSTQYAYGYWDYEFDGMNIKTFEQLYDAKVAVRPIYNVASDYYIEDFWNVNWYEPSNPNGIADPGVFKRMAYEMLGYAGYDQGFVTWLSQRSANDDDAIQKITGYSDMREYKLARYKDALSKLSSIPYFEHEQIEEVIKLAYATESRSSTNNSLAIKKILYSAVKRVTGDFTDGTIYTKSKTFYEVDNAQDLVRIVNENCSTKGVHITLTDNIDFSNVNAAGEAYAGQFVGFINGNGYSITGLEKPMFTNTVYAVISNITLDGDAGSLLSNRSTYTLIHDTKYEASKSLAKTKGQLYYEYRINLDLPVVMTMAKPRMTSVSESSLSISENSLAASDRAEESSLTASDSVSENGLGIANENSPTGVSENSLEAP